MVGTAIRPSPSPSVRIPGSVRLIRPSLANEVRLRAVMERLRLYVSSDTGPGSDSLYNTHEFHNLCLSLSRGIDYAVANNEVPDINQELLVMMKQICKRKRDAAYQAHLMVLMVSIKNACKIGWFSERDTQEFMNLIDEVSSSFCSSGGMNSGTANSAYIISTVMTRYYPQFKLCHILTSLEIEPGYGAFLSDFHISKSTQHTPQDKIMMFVAQTDKTETSACIISPQQVSFLLNGKAVEKRCSGNMDTGPQLPTDVTRMLKYGTNLLQAVGQFTGNYLIVIAFMSTMSPPDHPVLEDYVPTINEASESDPDIIEGQSRITLNCPISRSRITLPIKGQMCRHLQCYDFSNFVVINSRRPSWRCPHCNQHVCYTDIRVDQNIAKILKEVGSDVTEVMISGDGSWKAVIDSNDDSDFDGMNEDSVRQGPIGSPKSVSGVVDLTEDQGEMDVDVTFEQEDRKPPKLDDLTQDVARNPAMSLEPENAGTANGGAQNVDDFWAGIYRSTLDLHNVGNAHDLIPAYISNPLVPNQFSSASNMQIQRSQVVNSVATEHGHVPSLIPSNVLIPTNATRIPNAIQALPAQTHSQSPLQRSRSNVNPVIPGASLTASQVTISSGLTTSGLRGSEMLRQQQLLRSRLTSSQGLNTTPPLNRSISMQERSPSPGNRPSGPLPDFQRPPGLFSGFQNAHLHQTLNPRNSVSTSLSPNISRLQCPQTAVAPTSGTGGTQPSRTLASSQQASHTSSLANPVPLQTSSGDNGLMNSPSEENWRPTGQMRGSLGGRLHSDALSHLIIQPTQNAQPTRPSSGSLLSNTTAQATRALSVAPSSGTAVQATRPPSGSPSNSPAAQAARPVSGPPSSGPAAQATRPVSGPPSSGPAAHAARPVSGAPSSSPAAQATRPPSVTPLSTPTSRVNKPPLISQMSPPNAQASRTPPSISPLTITTGQAARPPSISPLSTSGAHTARPSFSSLSAPTAPPHLQHRPPSTISTAPPHLQGRPPSTITVQPPHLPGNPLTTAPAPPNPQDLLGRPPSAPSNQNPDIGHVQSTQ